MSSSSLLARVIKNQTQQHKLFVSISLTNITLKRFTSTLSCTLLTQSYFSHCYLSLKLISFNLICFVEFMQQVIHWRKTHARKGLLLFILLPLFILMLFWVRYNSTFLAQLLLFFVLDKWGFLDWIKIGSCSKWMKFREVEYVVLVVWFELLMILGIFIWWGLVMWVVWWFFYNLHLDSLCFKR